MNYNDSPDWLKAADAHSIGEDGTSWFEDLGTSLGNTPEFLTVSFMSGLNSFYNTGVSVGNIFREEDEKWELNDTGKWISDYDDNLGEYYQENKEAADLTGFIVGSFVPGMAAIKGLRAAQGVLRTAAAGEVGAGMRTATNILAPSMETYVKRAGGELAARSATFSFANGNALKAVATGTQQAVLESIAFESAVAATMFKSPLLGEMDGWDMLKTASMGVVFGGAFGAIGSAAVTYTGTQRLLQNADMRAGIFQRSTGAARGEEALPSDKVTQAALDAEFVTALKPSADEIRAVKLSQGESGESLSEEVIQAELTRLNRVRDENLARLKNEARSGMQTLARDDAMLANNVTDVTDRLSSRGLFETAFNARQVSRAGIRTEFDIEAQRLVREKVVSSPENAELYLSRRMSQTNVRLHSGSIGEKVVGDPADAMRVADLFTDAQIQQKLKQVPFKVNPKTDFTKAINPVNAELAWMTARAKGAVIRDGDIVGTHDLPTLELAVRSKVPGIQVMQADGKVRLLAGEDNIRNYLVQAKTEVIAAQKELGISTNKIEAISDVRVDLIEGRFAGNQDIGYFAQKSYADELSQWLNKDKQPGEQVQLTELDMHNRPRFAKIVYDTSKVQDGNGHILSGMNILEHRAKLAKQSHEAYFASYAGDRYAEFPEIPKDLMRRAWRGGSGAGFISNAGGGYGSLEQRLSTIGGLTYELEKAKVGSLKERLSPSLQRALTEPGVAERFSIINSLVSRTPESYVLDEFGENLIPKKLADYNAALAKAKGSANAAIPVRPQLHPGTAETIPLESDGIRALIRDHIAEADARLVHQRNLSTATGGDINTRYDGVFRIVRPDPNSLKHVAFVKDNSIVGSGHTTMIWGKDGADLERQIADIQLAGEGHYRVYTRGDAEDFYKAKGEFEYDSTLHENYIDIDKTSRGIMSNARPSLDTQTIVNDILNYHVKGETAVLKQSVLAKYQRESDELLRLANQWERYNSSVVGYKSAYELINSPNKNPYSAMIKSMLNATKLEEAAWWMGPQRKLDELFSSAYNRATSPFRPGAKITDADVERVEAAFQELGFKSAYSDVALELARDTRIDRGALTKFVRTGNSFLTTTVLRWDLFNSINTMVGQTVLYSAEMKGLTSAIKKGNADAAGELSRLANVKVPGIEDDLSILSPSKLLSRGMSKIHGPDGKALMEEMEKRGYLLPEDRQLVAGLDNLTLSGSESVADLNSKTAKIREMWEKAVNAGAKITGNNLTERLSKAYSIAAVKEVTDIAVKHGIMDSNTAWSYINTFNARVNGVIRASERPLMFQGPVGQSIGLFQSYQMNLLQQIFRNVGEGNRKSLAYMAGMQASVFGASSLPGFSLINGSLVGQASGNGEHKDLFTAGQVLFGHTGADWLMHGIPSNVLNASLYTRGDTNPRTWHVVPNPTNPEDIPFISGISQAIGSVFTAVKRAGDAGLVEGFLSGIEHSGLNRPLAGMAATARAFTTPDGQVTTTQKNGNFLYANDLWSWSTLIRLAGAKPIDEARTVSDYYRVGTYRAKDLEKREELGTRLKLAMLGGNEITDEQVGDFAEQYAKFGGRQSGFGSWFMNQYKNATVSQAEQLSRRLSSPYSRSMQELMGGRDSLGDLTDY